MKSHDPKRISDAQARQYWRAFVYVMQVHENRCIKRAGVAGLRARAEGCSIYYSQFNTLALSLSQTKTAQEQACQ